MKIAKTIENLENLAKECEGISKRARQAISEIKALNRELEAKKATMEEMKNRIHVLLSMYGEAKEEVAVLTGGEDDG